MVLEQVDVAELAERERVAARARMELAAAGLPVVAPGLDQIVSAGADVSVCEFNDCPGVKVSWRCSPRLWLSAKRAISVDPPDMPVIRHRGSVNDAMALAARMILVSAGFGVSDWENDYAPSSVYLLSAPDAETPPVWWLGDAELDWLNGTGRDDASSG